MTSLEERLAHLEAENAALREQLAAALAELQEVRGQQAKDSHNSSQPPSSDGLARKTRSLRQRSLRQRSLRQRSLRQRSGRRPGG